MYKLVLLLILLTLESCQDNVPPIPNQAERELAESYRQMERQIKLLETSFEIHWRAIGWHPSYCMKWDSLRDITDQLAQDIRFRLGKIELKLLLALNGDDMKRLKDSFNNSGLAADLISNYDRTQVDSAFIRFQSFLLNNFALRGLIEDLKLWNDKWQSLQKRLPGLQPLTTLHKVKQLKIELLQITETNLLNIMGSCSDGGLGSVEASIKLDSNIVYKGQAGRATIYLVQAFRPHKAKIVVNGRQVPVERGEGIYNFHGERSGVNSLSGYIEVTNSVTSEKRRYPFSTNYYVIDSQPPKK